MLLIEGSHSLPLLSGLSRVEVVPTTGEAPETGAMADCAAAKRRIGQDKYRKLFNLLRASFAIKYRKEDGIPAQVVDGLYLGSIGAALNKEVLQERGITHVVSALAKFQPPYALGAARLGCGVPECIFSRIVPPRSLLPGLAQTHGRVRVPDAGG